MDIQAEQWAMDDRAVAREQRRSNCRLWVAWHEKRAAQVLAEAEERAAVHLDKAQGYRDVLVKGVPEPSLRSMRDPWQ